MSHKTTTFTHKTTFNMSQEKEIAREKGKSHLTFLSLIFRH